MPGSSGSRSSTSRATTPRATPSAKQSRTGLRRLARARMGSADTFDASVSVSVLPLLSRACLGCGHSLAPFAFRAEHIPSVPCSSDRRVHPAHSQRSAPAPHLSLVSAATAAQGNAVAHGIAETQPIAAVRGLQQPMISPGVTTAQQSRKQLANGIAAAFSWLTAAAG